MMEVVCIVSFFFASNTVRTHSTLHDDMRDNLGRPAIIVLRVEDHQTLL